VHEQLPEAHAVGKLKIASLHIGSARRRFYFGEFACLISEFQMSVPRQMLTCQKFRNIPPSGVCFLAASRVPRPPFARGRSRNSCVLETAPAADISDRGLASLTPQVLQKTPWHPEQ
jgi:hypothetical protein